MHIFPELTRSPLLTELLFDRCVRSQLSARAADEQTEAPTSPDLSVPELITCKATALNFQA